ncbi:MAG: carbohydrate porin [Betaproteobacteria bacterium]|nr:carbohydrate porin [Betaproteobacteria bacterium]
MRRFGICLFALALAVPARAEEVAEDFLFKLQATYIGQSKRAFGAAYTGTNSLVPQGEFSRTFTSTLFAGWRLNPGTELYVNPEIALGVPLSHLSGLGGFTNNEIARTSGPDPTFYRARLFLRQTWGLGGDTEWLDSGQNQLAGKADVNRVVLSAGNLSAIDIFDANAYSHEPRRQFINWSLVTHGAWDFPADARGYTWGAALEYLAQGWALRAGRFMQPKQSNGLPLNRQILNSYGDVAEWEHDYSIAGRQGTLRLLAFRNVAPMGNFRSAIDNAPSTGGIPDLTVGRVSRSKVGAGASIEQRVFEHAGAFLRASRHDGKTETYAFTEIDRSLSSGVLLAGALWGGAGDSAGVAFARNGLSSAHREYLARGGLGFFLGDGRLNYRPEQIIEGFFSRQFAKALWATLDYQRIRNPGYNMDRVGPVNVWSLRVHSEF